MELLSMQMKRDGQYLARSLSFKGATFQIEDEQLSPAMLQTYNASVTLWNDLWVAIKRSTDASGMEKRLQRTQFWASSLRFWKQVLPIRKPLSLVAVHTATAAIAGSSSGSCSSSPC